VVLTSEWELCSSRTSRLEIGDSCESFKKHLKNHLLGGPKRVEKIQIINFAKALRVRPATAAELSAEAKFAGTHYCPRLL
jgi:hypothetical protein